MPDNPRLTVRCEYPDTDMPPTEVTFGLSAPLRRPHSPWRARLVLWHDAASTREWGRDFKRADLSAGVWGEL